MFKTCQHDIICPLLCLTGETVSGIACRIYGSETDSPGTTVFKLFWPQQGGFWLLVDYLWFCRFVSDNNCTKHKKKQICTNDKNIKFLRFKVCSRPSKQFCYFKHYSLLMSWKAFVWQNRQSVKNFLFFSPCIFILAIHATISSSRAVTEWTLMFICYKLMLEIYNHIFS